MTNIFRQRPWGAIVFWSGVIYLGILLLGVLTGLMLAYWPVSNGALEHVAASAANVRQLASILLVALCFWRLMLVYPTQQQFVLISCMIGVQIIDVTISYAVFADHWSKLWSWQLTLRLVVAAALAWGLLSVFPRPHPTKQASE